MSADSRDGLDMQSDLSRVREQQRRFCTVINTLWLETTME